jgi:hypothetical protein
MRYGVAIKKKYKYDEKGAPLEPFSIKKEMKHGEFMEGAYVDMRKDVSWDPWLESVREDMEKIDKNKCQQKGSDSEEDEDSSSSEDEKAERKLEKEEQKKELEEAEELEKERPTIKKDLLQKLSLLVDKSNYHQETLLLQR